MWQKWIPAWLRRSAIVHQSVNQNIYHCTVQKSGSQWVRTILSDPRTFQHCGLRPYQYESQRPNGYDARKITERRFDEPFPPNTILTPLYTDCAGFAALPKREPYKAFFVMRDPRDVLVSWYFSIKHSHPLNAEIERIRGELMNRSETDGLLYALDFLHEYGLFAAQRSWAGASLKDANVLLVRFEDLIGADSLPIFARILAHCDINMPRAVLDELLQAYRFERLSGRKPGEEDAGAHYRKGVAGDWRNHWNEAIQDRFEAATGDLLDIWTYGQKYRRQKDT